MCDDYELCSQYTTIEPNIPMERESKVTHYKRPQIWRLNPCLPAFGLEGMLHRERKT
jgi:hypothetical protein